MRWPSKLKDEKYRPLFEEEGRTDRQAAEKRVQFALLKYDNGEGKIIVLATTDIERSVSGRFVEDG
ncbi:MULTISPECIES: hypothetical protein [unclassified Mesorhizobium]|uniref:hypothetical protein n=1 Tax=unclassified Mesorhizobium TaxID=325217 RepID=UPI003335F95C